MSVSNQFKTITKTFIAVAAVSVVFSACQKKYNDMEPIELAALTIVHAGPDTQELDFIIGSQRANKDAFKYGAKIGYLGLYPGSSAIGVTEREKTKFLLTKNELYQSGKFYTTFLVDTGSKRAFLTINDKLDSIKVNEKAKVRFINTSPEVQTLDLAITGSATDIASNKAFKEYSVFTDVEPGESVALEVKDHVTKEVKATLPAMKLEKGKFYTVWAKGFKGKAETDSLKFKAAVYNVALKQ
ncbi:DUF4397 domain-containing protein [Pedobacter sp. PLR]|uniref:DUF4397 domain-containing protein n=1 Tax=Pedobacter sp. PLR TaxID=2994465 RepID=UPI002246EC70|nr:DUF4397 domain-containing protein [Pedobacter sp. PLR]MCX2452986.1 DUF4397 domain-containing protein [Pedobacter sp. PLR]